MSMGMPVNKLEFVAFGKSNLKKKICSNKKLLSFLFIHKSSLDLLKIIWVIHLARKKINTHKNFL
jgi:hypothetical protein